jgi:hypothetical protein
MWSVQSFYFCGIFLSSLTLIVLDFAHDRSIWSSEFFSSTTFKNVQGLEIA